MSNRFTCMGIAVSLSIGLALVLAAGVMGAGAAAGFLPSATVRYVAPGGACGGASPCYATIQAAVDASAAGDEIRIAAGAYTGVSSRGALKQVAFIGKSLTLRGGFTTANWVTPNPAANQTTVDAQGLGRGLVISGTVSAVPVAIIEGLRITAGSATGLGGYPGKHDAGGGVFIFLATATLRRCTLEGNTASTAAAGRGYGGGLAAVYSTLTVENSTVANNRGSAAGRGYGGGLMIVNAPGWGGPAVLTGNTITGNTGSAADWGSGGGIYLNTVSATLTNNTLQDNVATTATSAAGSGSGGGLYATGSEVTAGNNTARSNRAGASGSGGGIYLSDTNAGLTNNTLVANTAATTNTGSGGGLYASSELGKRVAELTLMGNVIQENVACHNNGPATGLCYGGGLRLSRVKATLDGNTIRDNSAAVSSLVNDNGRGGGISLNEPFDTTIAGNTVRGNAASTGGFGFGGGIELIAYTSRSDAILLTGNTVQSNTASLGFTGYGGGIYLSAITATLGSNLVASNTASKGRDGFGGGVYGEGGNVTVRDNTVEGNIASTADRGVGGGLRFGNVTQARTIITLTGNRIRGNTGSTAATNGSTFRSGSGGVELWLTSGTADGNTITGNTGATIQPAYCGGAAIHTGDNATVTFSNNVVQGNTGGPDGSAGGGLCLNGAVTAAQNTITDNRAAQAGAGRGGGVALGLSPEGTGVSGALTLTRNTIQTNTAGFSGDGRGGGLFVYRNVDSPSPGDNFTVSFNHIVGNVASRSDAGRGGGIYLGPNRLAHIDANTIVGNAATHGTATTGLGGGVYIVNSHEFSLTNNVIAANQASQGSGLWLGGNLDYGFDISPTWGRFLHNTLANNSGGAGAWLESPLPAGTLTNAYASGLQVLATVTGYYHVGDTLLFLHTNGTTRAWRKLVALEYITSKARLTLDSALPGAFPAGSTVRDASPMFINTVLAGHTLGLGAKDQPVTLVNTLWNGNATNTTDNLNAILTQGDMTGDPAFVNAAAGDYHIGAASAARDQGIDAGVKTDMDGEPRPFGPGFDIGADEYTGHGTPTPTATSSTGANTATPTPTRTPTVTPTRLYGRRIYLPLVLRGR